MESTQQEIPPQNGRLEYCSSPYEAASGAHALLILTPWKEYRELDLVRLRTLMEVPVIIDGRNLLDPEEARAAGFEYAATGRSPLDSDGAGSVGLDVVGAGGYRRTQ